MIAAILVSVILVLATPSLAAASCAWVLWSGVYYPHGKRHWLWGTSERGVYSYELKTAYASLEECAKALDQLATVEKETSASLGLPSGAQRTAPTELWLGARRDQTADVYRCLPDTIDPRGAKGGPR